MLNIVLYIFLGLVAAVVLVLGYAAATEPDKFRIARSVRIAAPAEKIFPMINDLHTFVSWSPFDKKDPNLKREYSGPQAGKGARYDWDGNREVGKGWLMISDATAPNKVDMDLHMLAPLAANNDVAFTLEPDGGATKVTWAMQGTSSLVAKVIHLCFNMDRMVGGEFEKGLADLKALAERS
jgi:hypothetical protein